VTGAAPRRGLEGKRRPAGPFDHAWFSQVRRHVPVFVLPFLNKFTPSAPQDAKIETRHAENYRQD
jgi:hypothetical protein